ncbi:MAG: efflux RND transporter permease subunit [Bacteroidales bacterium]|nr:efflux RND transporter permease subunit [Bacteroidales bacterium]
MLANFFIDRPIFATVLSLLITLAGGLAAFALPLSQYPEVTPATVQVRCNYPGANAQVVADTIAAPIEQRVNGVENMLYMSSQSTSDGTYTLTVTFDLGTDLNMAQVLVQNRVDLAMPELPEVVRATGVAIRRRSPEILLTASLNCPEGRYDQLYLSNYAVTRLVDELARIEGISDVTIFGQRDYSMRIWLDPDRLALRGLTALEVLAAIRSQNFQVSVGNLGGNDPDGLGPTSRPMTIVGRLTDPEEFEQIIVKVGTNGQPVRLGDVARAELGPRSSDVSNRFDTMPNIGLAVFLQPDANALRTKELVQAMLESQSRDLPEGVVLELGYDTTPVITESIREVFYALRDAVLLVAVVVLIFLQSWRSALIPLATVPVAIIGTFAAMALVGFTMNNLTLFGLVLAVGIVVDDAIVVVEAVQHQVDNGLAPREATIAAMREVSGPVVAVGMVLGAVFLPCAFLTGIVGLFFRQFALTIAISTLLSAFNSLTLSPALCALLLKPRDARPDRFSRILNALAGWPFRIFNRVFDGLTRGYVRMVAVALRVPILVLAGYAGLIGATIWGYQQFPKGFIPQQDKGFLIASLELPDAAAVERTIRVVEDVSRIALETPGVKHVNAVAGNSFVLNSYGSNYGSMFIILEGFDARKQPGLDAFSIAAKLRKRFAAEIPDAKLSVFPPSAVPRLGRAGGLKLMVEDRGELGPQVLKGQTDNLVERGNEQPALSGLFHSLKIAAPQLQVIVNPDACSAQGVNVLDVYSTMQATLGARYANDFNKFGRTWQVNVQAEPGFRNQLEDIRKLRVRSSYGTLVPIGALADIREITGPLVLERYNMYPAAAINGNVTVGASSGDAISIMERLAARELPPGMAAEWTELTFIEKKAQGTGLAVFGISVVVVFLVLAALYESWALPLAVILVVPMCVSSSLVGVWMAKHDVNIFTQIGFIVLVGLACKNAILIVEYAKWQREAGVPRREAVLAACRLRLRPIIMTSAAFILGVVPLLLADGAGAEMRRVLGTAVFSGMIGVTAFGIFLTPVFFYVIDWATDRNAFRSGPMAKVLTVIRWVLLFGWLRAVLAHAAQQIRRSATRG